MTVYLQDPDFTLYHGDVRDVLQGLPADSVDCAVTSPPFYALRDYGVDGQIGLEETPDLWASELVAVFREVRRVLKPSGTLWVECGDSYAQGGSRRDAAEAQKGEERRVARQEIRDDDAGVFAVPTGWAKRGDRAAQSAGGEYKAKDLIGAPWLLAFALRADGWYLRQCIVWHKPNAMPESAKDRCTTAHSYVFLLSKSARYWFDAEAIAEPATPEGIAREGRARLSAYDVPGQTPQRREAANGLWAQNGTKNARSVWTIPTSGYAEAHFATFPEALVERMLKAGCPEWVCARCGKARERVSEPTDEYAKKLEAARNTTGSPKHRGGTDGLTRISLDQRGHFGAERVTVGWSDCGCGAGFTPGVVLDPFGGSGTTALVARRLGRRSILVELNAEYCAMAAKRLSQLSLLAEPAA